MAPPRILPPNRDGRETNGRVAAGQDVNGRGGSCLLPAPQASDLAGLPQGCSGGPEARDDAAMPRTIILPGEPEQPPARSKAEPLAKKSPRLTFWQDSAVTVLSANPEAGFAAAAHSETPRNVCAANAGSMDRKGEPSLNHPETPCSR